jgi:hydroxyacyl-ACP dehydratase HTD2-like protein with hotdog domain
MLYSGCEIVEDAQRCQRITTRAGHHTNPNSAWLCLTLSKTYSTLGDKRYASATVNLGRVEPRLRLFRPRAKMCHVGSWACATCNIYIDII